MFELKSSMKRIVQWYFSWPARLVRSRQPWPDESGLSALATGRTLLLGHNSSWPHQVRDKPVRGVDIPSVGVCV